MATRRAPKAQKQATSGDVAAPRRKPVFSVLHYREGVVCVKETPVDAVLRELEVAARALASDDPWIRSGGREILRAAAEIVAAARTKPIEAKLDGKRGGAKAKVAKAEQEKRNRAKVERWLKRKPANIQGRDITPWLQEKTGLGGDAIRRHRKAIEAQAV